MKKFKLFQVALTVLAGAIVFIVISCGKDDKVTKLTNNTNTGTDVIDFRKSSTTGWTLDKVHSNVMWETQYFADNALLTGRFNNFFFEAHFDQANLDQSWLKGWVQLSTYNTGEPGRDAGPAKAGAKVGCGQGYMGVVWDSTDKTKPPFPTAATDTAWFKSTSVVDHGDGYLAKGTLTFRGLTKDVNFYFNYQGINPLTDANGKTTYRSGFAGWFMINANSDFKVNSTSIADQVKIRVDANLVKK